MVKEVDRIVVGRRISFNRIRGRLRVGGRCVVITECRSREDKEAVLGKGREIWKKWNIGIDEDLSMERRSRWRMLEVARRETEKGRSVEVRNRELRVEDRK